MLFPPVRFQLEIVEECASTQELLAQKRGDKNFHGSALLALTQTRGRGRRGRDWETGTGNLALSFALELPESSTVALLPFVSGLAAHKAASCFLPAHANLRLKWPNDLYLDGKKLGGMIAQARQSRNATEVIVGIGLNLGSCPPEAIALSGYGTTPAPESFAGLLLRELEEVLSEAGDFSWIRHAWESAAHLKDGMLYVVGESEPVKPLELLPTGELLVETAEGKPRKLASEDVSLRFTAAC